MQSRSAEPIERSRDTLLVDVGSETDLYGRTRLVVSPEGGEIDMFHDGKHETFPMGLGSADAVQLLESAASLGEYAARRAARKPLPDEPRYHVAVRRGGASLFEGYVWRSEIEGDPKLASLFVRLRALVAERSQGRALL